MKAPTYKQIWKILSVCFGAALIMVSATTAFAVNTIMVDNYNDSVLGVNTRGFWTGWGSSGNFSVEEVYLHTYDPEAM